MIPGLSTVGQQAFLRPGRNKLFVYQCRPDVIFASLPYVSGFQFKHTRESATLYDRLFDCGNALTPKEYITDKIKYLLLQKKYSEEAFVRNLHYNPKDNATTNRRKLSDIGYQMEKRLDVGFTEEELKKMWFSNPSQIWELFWEDIAMPMLNQDQYFQLLDLPNNSQYSQFFELRKWINRIKK